MSEAPRHLGLLLLPILDRNLFGQRGRFNDVTGHSGDHLIAIHDTATVSASAGLLGKPRAILHVQDFYRGLNSDGAIRDFVRQIENSGWGSFDVV